jgi:hypothetical protein
VHRDRSGRRAAGNDRRLFLVEPDTTGLIAFRQRIETGRLERKPAAFPSPFKLTDMTKSLCGAVIEIALPGGSGPALVQVPIAVRVLPLAVRVLPLSFRSFRSLDCLRCAGMALRLDVEENSNHGWHGYHG